MSLIRICTLVILVSIYFVPTASGGPAQDSPERTPPPSSSKQLSPELKPPPAPKKDGPPKSGPKCNKGEIEKNGQCIKKKTE